MAGLCQTGHLQAVENRETRLFSIAIPVSNLYFGRRVERITPSGRRPQASENSSPSLQTQQQLAIQSLSIANSDSQNILSLFR
jgi:hypothetical protein|nr:hypothetical protein [Neorhizobium tomejilense]